MVKVSVSISISTELLNMLEKVGISKSEWASAHADEDLKWFNDNNYKQKNILENKIKQNSS